jgi:hypothetical protein
LKDGVLTSDVIIYDIEDSYLEEIEFIFKILKFAKFED